MKRKLLAAILSCAMTVTVLAGCGQTAEAPAGEVTTLPADSSTPAADGAEAPAADASADEGEIYMFISSPEYADAINTLIEEYKNVAPNVTINYETTQNDYPTMLKAKLNSGEVPDIFSSTSGKEIDTYLEYSYDLSNDSIMTTMDPAVASSMSSTENGGKGCYGFAIKGNYFGIVYNKEMFETAGIAKFPETASELKDACDKLTAAGFKPFTTGFAEWWVFKHTYQSFVNAAADGAGISTADLVTKFEKGEAKVSDYPELYDNYFAFLDLAKEYGDAKPLETDLSAEEAAFANGEVAMVLGQGAWIESDVLSINPDIKIGFAGYPTTEDAAETKVISGSDQALHVNKDSKNLQATLNFVNWWYTSDYGKSWFTDVAGVVPPIVTDAPSEFEIIKQGAALSDEKGSGALAICYSTDSWHQTCGQILQSYIAGTISKDEACAQIEEQWAAIDGAK
ncbi:MAG: extracellular solute-binding protein [Lachnospiraceae bacterium]|jgi:raffinose/stachyose/melibiose transport system substrate-binding protein|nr:extracellular solute-binding protein [Lachnospiraceae bacterium]